MRFMYRVCLSRIYSRWMWTGSQSTANMTMTSTRVRHVWRFLSTLRFFWLRVPLAATLYVLEIADIDVMDGWSMGMIITSLLPNSGSRRAGVSVGALFRQRIRRRPGRKCFVKLRGFYNQPMEDITLYKCLRQRIDECKPLTPSNSM